MRKLNKKQTTFVTEWFNRNWTGAGSVYTVDQMSQTEQDKLQAMNDHETLWQNADRLINDLSLKKLYG